MSSAGAAGEKSAGIAAIQRFTGFNEERRRILHQTKKPQNSMAVKKRPLFALRGIR